MVIYKIYDDDYILQAVIEDDWKAANALIHKLIDAQRRPYVEIHEHPKLLSSPQN